MTKEEHEITQIAENLNKIPNFEKTAFLQLIEDTGPLVVLRILARFAVGLQESLIVIENSIAQENSEPIWQACHKLTGSAELIGFKDFGAKSRKLNRDVKALPDTHAHLDELKLYIRDGEELVRKIKSSFPQFTYYL